VINFLRRNDINLLAQKRPRSAGNSLGPVRGTNPKLDQGHPSKPSFGVTKAPVVVQHMRI